MPPSIVVLGAGPGLGRAVARRYAQSRLHRRPGGAPPGAARGAGRGPGQHRRDRARHHRRPVRRRRRATAGRADPRRGRRPRRALLRCLRRRVHSGRRLDSRACPGAHAAGALLAAGPGAGVPAGHARTRRRRHLERARRQRGAGHAAHLRRVRPGRAAQLPAVTARRGSRQRHICRRLYIGAAIKHTPFYERRKAERAAGTPVPDMPEVDPDDLADLLWTMHSTKSQPEATYPAGLSGH